MSNSSASHGYRVPISMSQAIGPKPWPVNDPPGSTLGRLAWCCPAMPSPSDRIRDGSGPRDSPERTHWARHVQCEIPPLARIKSTRPARRRVCGSKPITKYQQGRDLPPTHMACVRFRRSAVPWCHGPQDGPRAGHDRRLEFKISEFDRVTQALRHPAPPSSDRLFDRAGKRHDASTVIMDAPIVIDQGVGLPCGSQRTSTWISWDRRRCASGWRNPAT